MATSIARMRTVRRSKSINNKLIISVISDTKMKEMEREIRTLEKELAKEQKKTSDLTAKLLGTKTRKKAMAKYTVDGKGGFFLGPAICKMIQLIVKANTHYRLSDLTTMFPKEVYGKYDKYPIFLPFEEADRLNSILPKKNKKYFTHPDQVIELGDGTRLAVTNQWDKYNTREIFNLAQDMGVPIERIR